MLEQICDQADEGDSEIRSSALCCSQVRGQHMSGTEALYTEISSLMRLSSQCRQSLDVGTNHAEFIWRKFDLGALGALGDLHSQVPLQFQQAEWSERKAPSRGDGVAREEINNAKQRETDMKKRKRISALEDPSPVRR